MVQKRNISKDEIYNEISKLVAEGKTVSITAKGYSMNPFVVHMRDQITLGPWKDEDICKGVVALVKDGRGNVLIHRIIKRSGNKILLEGDGNIGIRETATIDNIAGIMHSITRKGKVFKSKGFIWRAYSWIWLILRPVRRYPLGLWRKFNPQPPLSS